MRCMTCQRVPGTRATTGCALGQRGGSAWIPIPSAVLAASLSSDGDSLSTRPTSSNHCSRAAGGNSAASANGSDTGSLMAFPYRERACPATRCLVHDAAHVTRSIGSTRRQLRNAGGVDLRQDGAYPPALDHLLGSDLGQRHQ